jgi:hypothetical protein
MACEGCGAQAHSSELQLSGAGQWLCRACLALYTIEIDNRRTHELQIYRRCACGREITPADQHDVPLYVETNRGRQVNVQYAFRSTIYECSCGRRFKLLHPVLALFPILVVVLCVWGNGSTPPVMRSRFYGQRASVDFPLWALILIALGVVLAFAAPQLYYRWRYPRVR